MTYPIGYRDSCFLAIVNGKLMQFASDTDYYDYISQSSWGIAIAYKSPTKKRYLVLNVSQLIEKYKQHLEK